MVRARSSRFPRVGKLAPRRGSLALLALGMLLTSVPWKAGAAPPPVAAAQCDGDGSAAALTGSTTYAASFIAAQSGKLDHAFVEPWNPGHFVVEVFLANGSAVPPATATPIASAAFDVAGSGFNLEFPQFTTGKLEKGLLYDFVVTVPSTTASGVTVNRNGTSCADTLLSRSANGAPGSYLPDASNDLNFAVFVQAAKKHRH